MVKDYLLSPGLDDSGDELEKRSSFFLPRFCPLQTPNGVAHRRLPLCSAKNVRGRAWASYPDDHRASWSRFSEMGMDTREPRDRKSGCPTPSNQGFSFFITLEAITGKPPSAGQPLDWTPTLPSAMTIQHQRVSISGHRLFLPPPPLPLDKTCGERSVWKAPDVTGGEAVAAAATDCISRAASSTASTEAPLGHMGQQTLPKKLTLLDDPSGCKGTGRLLNLALCGSGPARLFGGV